MTFKIPDITLDVGHFFGPVNNVLPGMYVWVYMGLDGSTCSECRPERTCHFQPPVHVPRPAAGVQTYVLGLGGLPVCHGAESTRKDPRPEEKKMPTCEKNTFVKYVQGSPSGCGRCDIPGVTQVLEENSRILQCWREEVMTYHSIYM